MNKKGDKFNHHLKEICNKKNFFLIDYSKKIKASHLNSSRLHLNRKGAIILTSSLTKHISEVCNWQLSHNTLCCNVSESDFEENESVKENCRSILNSLHKDNLDKPIFALFFFNWYLAPPWPTSGHYWGGILTHLMLITVFYIFEPNGHQKPCSKVGTLCLAERFVGFEPETFWFW